MTPEPPDMTFRVTVYASPPPGWDPDTPYTEGAIEGSFEVRKDLATSNFVITDPDGRRYVQQDYREALGLAIQNWMKLRGTTP